MSNMVLSICIPVYNCGLYLPAALDSILSQMTDQTEVVVYDGASTDDTERLMQAYVSLPNVRYHRGVLRGGIDADLVTCVSKARGEFCWLFSGDDVMRAGALDRAMTWIHRGPDVVLCRHTICDLGMRFIRDYHALLPAEVREAQFADADQRVAWFAHAATTEAFFSFLSSIIVRKSTWDRGGMHGDFASSCWAHAVRLLALAPEGLRVSYVPEVWLDQRGENDSFVGAGVVNRYRIAIEGYHRIGRTLFGHESQEAYHLRRVLRVEFTLRMFLNAKVLCLEDPERESRALLDSLYRQLHSDRSVQSIFLHLAYRLTPGWLAAVLRTGVRGLRRVVGQP